MLVSIDDYSINFRISVWQSVDHVLFAFFIHFSLHQSFLNKSVAGLVSATKVKVNQKKVFPHLQLGRVQIDGVGFLKVFQP